MQQREAVSRSNEAAAAYQAGVGADDKPPIGISIAHDGSDDQPNCQQHNAEADATNGSNEICVAIHNDVQAKVALPEADAGLLLGDDWFSQCVLL